MATNPNNLGRYTTRNNANKTVLITTNGVRFSNEKAVQPGTMYGRLTKGSARKLRKQLRSLGFTRWAGEPAVTA